MDIKRDIKGALHDLGFDKPRKHQVAPIKSLTDKQDTIVIAGTSSGKMCIRDSFTIMESFTDKLRVRSTPGKGTVVTMVKLLRERGA